MVPAVILGTRRNMPATRILPRPGRDRSALRHAHRAGGVAFRARPGRWNYAMQSRAAILAELGEPDLAA